LHLLSDAGVVCVTSMGLETRKWNPSTGAWAQIAGAPGAGYDYNPRHPEDQDWSSVLLPLIPPYYTSRVLLVGREAARILELGERQGSLRGDWRDASQRRLPEVAGRHPANPLRRNCTAILLPDGNVLVVGGNTNGKDDRSVLAAELYDPFLDQWTTLADATVPRGYHSVALLLPDGQVWTAGSNLDGQRGLENRELRMELFAPPYLFRGPRPIIDEAPDRLLPAVTFVISTPQASLIRSVALLRCGSVTHAFDADQRYVGLSVVGRTPNALTVTSPPDHNVAPPGYYLLFILDGDGVPSLGRFVRVG
jgi:hypothetical protein